MISRAILLVGVSRTGGGLTPLQAVESGLDDMQSWALDQGISSARIGRFSDVGNGKVRVRDLQDWIKRQDDDLEVPDQLIVYFSGHGFHGAMGEFWLLSDAPNNTSEAISLTSTEALARNCSFGHVVLLSDACRVPANSIQFGYVTGSSLFPNKPPSGPSKPVDQFFASSLGQPALEVDDNGKLSSIFTAQLARSLSGLDLPLLEPQDKIAPTPVVVRAWPLKRFLPRAVSQRLRALRVQQAIVPDAIVTSEPEMWLATFPTAPAPSALGHIPLGTEGDSFVRSDSDMYRVVEPSRSRGFQPIVSLDRMSSGLQIDNSLPAASTSELFHVDLALALNPQLQNKRKDRLTALHDAEVGSSESHRSVDQLTKREQPAKTDWHFETECGFVIAGATVLEAHSTPGVMIDLPSPTEVRVSSLGRIPELALLKFAGGQGFLLPAVAGQIGYIATGPDGSVNSLAYEPSSQRQEWQAFENKSEAIRVLRSFLNTTAASGDLRLAVLNDVQLIGIQQTMLYGPHDFDLAILILLGYISYNSRDIALLNQLCTLALRHCQFLPMDLAILALLSNPAFRFDVHTVLPPFPLLAQGWPLMDACSFRLPTLLSQLRGHVLPAAWTSFDADGYDILDQYLNQDPKHSVDRPEATRTLL